MSIPEGFKLVPVEAHIEKGFDVVEGRHVPTIKIMLSACHADDSKTWDRRDAIGSMIADMLAAAPTPPQPIYDEAKERELFEEWADEKGFCLDCEFFKKGNNYTDQETGWLYESWLACAQSRAKYMEVGYE